MGSAAADSVVRGGPVLGVPGSATVLVWTIAGLGRETHRTPPNNGRCDVGAMVFVEWCVIR